VIDRPSAHGRRLALLAVVLCGSLWVLERSGAFLDARLALHWGDGARDAVAAAPVDDVTRGWPVLSLVVDHDDLYDPARGMLANVLEHGVAWERPGTAAFFDQGRLRFATGVGVRVHGGSSRESSDPQGFRLYLRRRYGARQLPPGVLFEPDAQPVRRLVVHNDLRVHGPGDRWRLANPVAYDIAEAMGAIAPDTHPVRFFLNGELQGMFVLTERIDEEFFAAHWGHPRVRIDQAEFDRLWEWVAGRRPLTMADAATRLDLDNLTRWFLAVAFCVTRDAYQGPGQFRDLTRDEASWFWVNWDMDRSFRVWDADNYSYLLEQVGGPRRGRNRAEPRSLVLTALLQDDPAYREYVARIFDRVMNHRITPAFLRERLDHYRAIATTLQPDDLAFLPRLERFLDRRPAFFRQLTEQWLNTGPSHPLRVSTPGALVVTIDEEPVSGQFEGRFLPDRDIVLAVPDARERFVEWRVNGAAAGSMPELHLTLDRPTDVEAIFAGETTRPFATPRAAPAGSATPAWTATPIRWRRIPAGRFLSGCIPDDPDCGRNERQPARPAAIDRPFDMLESEVTVGQFAAFAARAGVAMPALPAWVTRADQPMVNLTWEEADAFCRDWQGRLPTELEWEYAARGRVSGRLFPWAGGFDGEANLEAEINDDVFQWTSPAGSFAPNGYGLVDMIGNVWEWTADRYYPDAPEGAFDLRAVRGGSFMTEPRSARISERAPLSRRARHNLEVGFRCVRRAGS
jgi:formylglycine-generating enzyme required for sulfatase activity